MNHSSVSADDVLVKTKVNTQMVSEQVAPKAMPETIGNMCICILNAMLEIITNVCTCTMHAIHTSIANACTYANVVKRSLHTQ